MRSFASRFARGSRRLRPVVGVAALSLLVLAPVVPAAAAPSAPSAFVRVNQVGYPAEASKRAYLMSTDPETGATFAVRSGGSTVFTADVGPDLGGWSNTFKHVYPLDFDAVAATGTYTIQVTGPATATSPSFGIASRSSLYTSAIANALSFYQNERDGRNFIASDLRTAAAHLNDESAMTYLTPNANNAGSFSGDLTALGDRIDASGGWWDAGDYLKFVQTTSYTDAMLLLGVRDFPSQMGSTAWRAEARFGAEWLMKMWDDSTRTLFYQVGIGSGNSKTRGDHDIWRLPQDDDTFGQTDPVFRYIRNRPVFRAGPPGSPVSPNLAGRDAAAFALCYQVFRTSDPTFANACLLSAEHIFDLADTSPRQLLTVIPFSFYPEEEWRDDLELGAVELYRALAAATPPAGLPHTDPAFYLGKAAEWADAYITGPNDAADTLNLYDVSGLAHAELARAIAQAGNPTGLAVSRGRLLGDLKKQLDGALAQAATDPFGFGFPWATWDTTSHGAGLSVLASEYDDLTGTATYADFANRWLANILGANAWGTSLIVGDGTTFPHCMQHQVTNLVGSLDGTPPILAGAVVEGPNGTLFRGSLTNMRACPPDGSDPFARFNGSGAKFRDDAESFSTVEPAIDLGATSPLAFAWQTQTAQPGERPQTVVSIHFDDGNADQMNALTPLQSHGMHATFYVNSGFIGDPTHLSLDDLHTLANAGNEIAGHTVDHANVKKLKPAAARAEICGDRDTITGWGFPATSFAYPFGSYDAGSEQIVAECGYSSGRGVSGVDSTKTFAETIPPLDAYGLRMTPSIKQGTTMATVEGWITAAERHGGGWVMILIHHLCNQCDAYSATVSDFTALLDWLEPRAGVGTIVRTTDQVMTGQV